MKYIDVHTHPFKEYYEDPYQTVVEWHKNNMEKLFICGTSREDSVELLDLCGREDYLFPIIGIHPTLSKGAEDGEFIENIINKDVVAIGEIGLDYHYDNSPSKEIQKSSFIAQLEIAKKYNIAAMLHIRDALEDAYEIISQPQYQDLKIIFHSFSGDENFVRKCLGHKNFYFSISGVVTFKNAKILQDAVKLIPIDRLFCETDTPYLAPTPMRGKPNISPYVMYTYQYIANLKNIGEEKLVSQIQNNVKKVFKI
ncbi:TatD family hydrolase [Mycoplasma phocoeninasale]|uniref:TatD family hydrolase n=1 Tax=Mycoplasma phocoeninasale TaxID=2726117 RepID=A0A858U699_9MOLU|nr:TatD family hydrolase [Mycoplasma phocoeninasale]QJG66308.1 TatD family hydrolase [Mycoplasma phocoeninasale]